MALFVLCHVFVGTATNLQTVLAGRFFAGLFGSAPIAIAPRVASDIREPTERAIALFAYTTALSMGPYLGVIGGEFTLLIPASNWRWTIWLAAIAGIFSVSFAHFAVPELEKPITPAAQANSQAKKAVDSKRPTSPTQLTVAICASLIHGVLHMLLLVYPMSFEIYRAFPFGISSLPFLAILVGLVIGCGRFAKQAIHLRREKGTKTQATSAQNLLSLMQSGCYTLAIAMSGFALTSHRDTNPWPQILSGVLIGYGVSSPSPPKHPFQTNRKQIITVLAPALVYLVETSSADKRTLSVYTFLQSIIAAVFPLFVIPMYKKLGVQWASGCLATMCLAVALVMSLVCKRKQS